MPIVVPCHRVIGADGSLTGYGGGLERKRALLDLREQPARWLALSRRGRGPYLPGMRRTLAALMCLALCWAPPSASAATALDRTVSVRGEATVTVPNDSAALGFSVTKTRSKRSAALRAVASGLRAVIAAVQESPGVGEGDNITTGRISVREVRVGASAPPTARARESPSSSTSLPRRAGQHGDRRRRHRHQGTELLRGQHRGRLQRGPRRRLRSGEGTRRGARRSRGAILGPVVSIAEDGEVVPLTPASSEGPRKAKDTPPVKPGRSTVTATLHVVFALQ